MDNIEEEKIRKAFRAGNDYRVQLECNEDLGFINEDEYIESLKEDNIEVVFNFDKMGNVMHLIPSNIGRWDFINGGKVYLIKKSLAKHYNLI